MFQSLYIFPIVIPFDDNNNNFHIFLSLPPLSSYTMCTATASMSAFTKRKEGKGTKGAGKCVFLMALHHLRPQAQDPKPKPIEIYRWKFSCLYTRMKDGEQGRKIEDEMMMTI